MPPSNEMTWAVTMKIHSKDFRVQEGEGVHLDKWPTRAESIYKSKEEYQKFLGEHVEKLSSLQQMLYASDRYAILLIFQAMEAAGKDGAIKHVMSGVNPQGCQVFSFKHPTATELQHDFLWRTTRELPERGRIGIFNRSYYEEVLIARVHPEILRNEDIPDAKQHGKGIWHQRRWCTRQIQGEMAPGPKLLRDDRLATDGIRAPGRQHPVQHRHADGSLSLLGREATGSQTRSDQRLVATHCRFY